MASGQEACDRIKKAQQSGSPINWKDVDECNKWKSMLNAFARLLLKKHYPKWEPDPDPWYPWKEAPGDPMPWYGSEIIFTEIVLDALRGGPTGPHSVFKEIIDSGAHLEVVKNLIERFEEAAVQLKQELAVLERKRNTK